MNTKKIIFAVVIVLLVAAFGISAFMVGNYMVESKKNEELKEQFAVTTPTIPATSDPVATTEAATTEPEEVTEATMIPAYQEKYELNDDIVGYVHLLSAGRSYPVMQTPDDPNYYLYRNEQKADSKFGAIYAWSEADVNEPSDNITLFGHNMADGSMFASLNAYTSKYAWDTNPLIGFDTLYEYHTYKIYAVFKTSANIGEGFSYHKFVDAANEQEFNDFVKKCKELSFYDTGITPVYGDKLIALSTCEYTLNNGRLVVCAVRVT